MNDKINDTPSNPGRRRTLQTLAVAGAAVATSAALPFSAFAQQGQALITKPIPSSGQAIPVIGLGTNAYGVTTLEERAPLREVIARLAQVPGSIIDTAPSYRNSEEVLGELIAELGVRDQLFIATKVTAQDNDLDEGRRQIENSFNLLKTDVIDLIQVHNLRGAEVLLPYLAELKEAGRYRYIGITTSNNEQHEETAALIRQFPLDFVQVNYSLGNRAAEATVLPAAQERGLATLLNIPLGGRRGSLFGRVREVPVPEWAAEFDATSWAQVFLKYSLSHPAVTAVIPGTTNVRNLEDNLGAGRGRLPDAAARARIEALWATLDGDN